MLLLFSFFLFFVVVVVCVCVRVLFCLFMVFVYVCIFVGTSPLIPKYYFKLGSYRGVKSQVPIVDIILVCASNNSKEIVQSLIEYFSYSC